MENELISVIVPVYNVEKYLDRCISSIVDQTYSDLEILLIDDGSTDRSGGICDAWMQKDKRIRVIHKKNGGGVSAARNTGIEQARGAFLGFIDSDDYIAPDMYEYLYSHQVPGGIASCGFIEVDERNRKRRKPEEKHFLAGGTYSSEDISEIYMQQEWDCSFRRTPLQLGSYVWNKLYDRKIFESLRFPDGRKYEDISVTLPSFHQAKAVRVLPECKYYYVQRDGSIVHRKGIVNLDFLQARKQMLQQAQDYQLKKETRMKAEMLLVRAFYNVYRDVLRLPAAEAKEYQAIAETCKNMVHSEMFKCTPFSFKRRFWLKIWTAPLYQFLWKWKR